MSLATLVLGLGAAPADAQVNPAPPSTSFVYVALSGATPRLTNPSYVEILWVQYRYGDNAPDWWFRIAPRWVQEAGSNLVTFDFTVATRGKRVNNYQQHKKPATYFFHSSMGVPVRRRRLLDQSPVASRRHR